jgi:membrane AbrB-like protein
MAWFAEKKDLVLTPISLIAALLATLKAQRIAWRGFVAERFTHVGWGFWRDPEAVSKAKERLATFTLAWLAALTFKALSSPLPWMIGPILLVSIASMSGLPTRSWKPLRNAGQFVIGMALGLYFNAQIGAEILQLWWVILLSIAWALAVGAAFGVVLYKTHRHHIPDLTLSTCFFSGAIGGASEMTLLAEKEHGRTDLVAAAHSLRVLVIAIVIPFTLKSLGYQRPALVTLAKDVSALGLMELAVLCYLGVWILKRWGRSNPWFLGALLVSMGLSLSGMHLSAVPTGMSNWAQMFLGVSLGVRFSRDFIKMAPKWLMSVGLGSLALIVLCALFAYLTAWLTGVPTLTMVLGTAPGGIAEMAITAKVLQLDVPLVTSLQVCRLLAVLVLVEPLYRLWDRFWGEGREGS